ncbi:MAG: glycogen/starch/alpha-glucan phosphorylase [Clostridiaceae bacterium]|jgi:starch phosphorylase|nr:glycogen/starch/alpha-glucan phosphorylase [Clostridiaceae bacterium]
MSLTIPEFQNEFSRIFKSLYAFNVEEGSSKDHFMALAQFVRAQYSNKWLNTKRTYFENKEKQVYYFSMEFLPGTQLRNNLLNIGIIDVVKNGLSQMGLDFDEIAANEVDPALGNGGLGRLASCFMDSMAATGIAGNGNGIRYRYGLFKQKFVNGYQVELPENWLRNINPWEVRREDKSVIVRFGGNVNLISEEGKYFRVEHTNTTDILAVPYDTPIIGYRNNIVNTLRLWSAEIPYGDEEKFPTLRDRDAVKEITEVLYPDDSNYEGRLLRLKQEYFFVSAGIQSIIRYFKSMNLPMVDFGEKIQLHINDTHPSLIIPELMRILMDEERMSWEVAWEITKKATSYTNHTILQEAMERWPESMMQGLLPRIYQILKEIDKRHVVNKSHLYNMDIAQKTRPFEHGQIKMANIAILGSHSVNGVSKLHTEILRNDTLRDFATLYPYKFNNKTNGITMRRWVMLSNPDLTKLIDNLIGESWRTNPNDLRILRAFSDDHSILEALAEVKLNNKRRFAQYIKKEMNIDINTNAIFDVQIKRLHAYKRQLLKALHILHRYLQLKDDPTMNMVPRVFIFGAKAAPSYTYAKQIIKFINELANLINNDTDVGDKMKIVFVENYGVSSAELIIPAADISEQISTAGKEASGTSNMKLMANGAITVATLDGANVEITEYVGEDNILLFGMRSEDVNEFYRNGNYNSREIYEKNPRIHRVLNALVNGTVPNIENEGKDIFDSLVTYNDEYFVLNDFDSYDAVQQKADELYQNKHKWYQKALINISQSGNFSSDYTISSYARDIWHIYTTRDRERIEMS